MPASNHSAARARVLIVDDERRNLTLLEAFLAPLGHEIVFADGGPQALEAFHDKCPDLVLLDVKMPDLDGIDVLTHIRASGPVGERVPVILVTGQADRADRLRGLEAGADEFLEKPVDRAILLARVRTLLRLKRTTDDLAARNESLERLQREQRELTAFIVHDLKSPIAVAAMSISYVRGQLPKAHSAVLESLADAEEATRRTQRMVEDMLAVVQLEESRFPLQERPVNIEPLFEELVRSHSREARFGNVAFSVEADPHLSVPADPAVLRRVLDNLLDNALRYTPSAGLIRLAARTLTGGEAGACPVEISVSNTGRAIPQAERGRVFDKFTRGAEARATNAGLGLYFCRRAIEAHGGTIELTQTDEWPVSFVLRLPLEHRERS